MAQSSCESAPSWRPRVSLRAPSGSIYHRWSPSGWWSCETWWRRTSFELCRRQCRCRRRCCRRRHCDVVSGTGRSDWGQERGRQRTQEPGHRDPTRAPWRASRVTATKTAIWASATNVLKYKTYVYYVPFTFSGQIIIIPVILDNADYLTRSLFKWLHNYC